MLPPPTGLDGLTPPQREALGPMLAEAERLKVPTEAMAFPSRDVASDIARVARVKRSDLVLIGFHKPVVGQTILGGTVHRVLTGTDADVAVLVDRGLGHAPSVLVPYRGSPHDRLAVDLAKRIAACLGAAIVILHVVPPGSARHGDGEPSDPALARPSLPPNAEVWVAEDVSPVNAVLRQSRDFDLLVMGLGEEWGLTSHLIGLREERIAREWRGSLLLVRKHVPVEGLSAPVVTSATPVEGVKG